MAEHDKTHDLTAKRDALLSGVLKNVRTATLAASLVPVALVAAQPVTTYAQQPCDPSAFPPCDTVPEPATLLLLAPAAAALIVRHRRNSKKD